MNFNGHLTISALVGISIPVTAKIIGIDLNQEQALCVVSATILGGNFPDLDTQSYPSKFYALFGLIASIFFISRGEEEYILFVAVPFFIIKMSKHRGYSHSYFVPLFLVVGAFLFPKYEYFLVPFAIGVCVHLFLDSIYFWKLKSWVR